jgi:hypothetical protein
MPRVDEIQIFCSYAHEDRQFRDELVKHLELLRESLLIRAWHDGELTAGQDWQQEIETHMREAHVILLLVSVDFLGSQFVREHELPIALAKHKSGDALVIPVIMRPVQWEQAGLNFLQALPDGLRPVATWAPQDLAYVNICEGVFAAVLVWQGRKKATGAAMARPTSVRRRVLDLALSRRVPVGKATFLAVMVRRVGEGGLRAILAQDSSYGIDPDAVESSKSFPLEFPRNPDGRLSPVDLTIKLETGDFICRAPDKILPVPAQGDSVVCVFLLEAKRAGSLAVAVEISHLGKVLLAQVLRSEGVPGARYEPAVQEFACDEFGEPPITQTFSPGPVVGSRSVEPAAYTPPRASPPEPTAYMPPPTARTPFVMRPLVMALAGALVLAAAIGTWYAKKHTQGQEALASSAVKPAAPQEPAVSAAPPIDQVGSASKPPEPPLYVASSPRPEPTAPSNTEPANPAPVSPPRSPPSPQSAPPANYQICAFASGATILNARRPVTLAQARSGLEARCGFSGSGQTYDVSIHWQFTGSTRSESTENATISVGNAVSVATSGPHWTYNGPTEPGFVQVTVRSSRKSDSAVNSWTGTVQVTP